MNISLSAETIFNLGGLSVTNTLLTSWLVIGLIAILSYLGTRKLSAIPKGWQNFWEMVLEFLFKTINDITGSEKRARQFLPWAATFFLFILFANWTGLLPGFGSIGLKENGHLIPIFRAASSDLTTTVALALISVISAQILGIASLGFIKYGKKYINFKGPIEFFVGLLELLGEVTKIISFSFRLFGNIFAGEVMLTVMTVLIPYFLPLPFYGLEIFVGAIQAFVFMMLTVVFWKMAIMESEH